jgi:hypothetical protein
MQRGELNVDPIQSEFFSTEAIDGLTEALVRESIQNTLDAAQAGATARVRFWFSGTESALPNQNGYLTGIAEHLNAKGSGLRSLPDFQDGIPFLLVEDFGTRGLCGDPEQEKDIAGTKNDFYYFWRNVGRSGKQDSDRGRWGLGKNVFPASSRINTFLGLTIRNQDPSTLLMGQSVLKVHEINGVRKYPYGYFAEIDPVDGFSRPVTDQAALEQFRKDFQLSRTTEPGLSIVVPFPDPEITEGGVLKAVLRQYFYPIMSGTLVISVATNGGETTVDQQSLPGIVTGMDETFKSELEPVLKLTEWAASVSAHIKTKQPPAGSAPKWESDAIAEDILKEIRPQFEQGLQLAFEVPVHVKPNSGIQQLSYFRVFLERDLAMESHRPTFVREGLIVTDAVKTKLRGVRALVVITDKPLATMLGDAENPAHTEWQTRSTHFKDRYLHGSSTLSYVKNSVVSIIQMLTQSKDQQDYTALADVFFLVQPPTPTEKRKDKSKKPEPGPEPPIPLPPDPPQMRSLRLTQVKGGFTVLAGADVAKAYISAAYEVRRGNAFKKYQPADFELGKAPIEITVEGTTVIEDSLNQLVIGPLQTGSKVTVTGFDPARDLAVRTSVEE